jgi:hypothetical protein
MGQRRLAFPQSMMQDQQLISRKQDSFLGMNTNDPASELGQGEFPYMENAIPFGKSFQGRSGCKPMNQSEGWAVLDNEIDEFYGGKYLAEKIGDRVYISDNQIFLSVSSLVVGDYFVSENGDYCEQITEIVPTPSEGLPYFVSRTSGDISESVWYLRKMVWGGMYSEHQKGIVYQQGKKFWYTSYGKHFEIVFNGAVADLPDESESRFRPEETDIIVFNSNGIYRIVFNKVEDSLFAIYFKMNSDIPTVRISDISPSAMQTKMRNYLYSMVKITGSNSGLGDRTLSGSNIVQESATVAPDTVTRMDATKIYGEKKVGPSTLRYGTLTSGPGINLDMTLWRAVLDGSFKIQINDLSIQEIVCNFSKCYTMADIAIVIRDAMQPYFVGAECFFINEAGTPKIVITSGEVDGGTVSYATQADHGTDILSTGLNYIQLMEIDAEVALDNKSIPDQSYLVQGMKAPTNSRHWSHFGIWGSKDPNAVAGNLEDLITWVKDVPLIKTFRASFVRLSGIASVVSGEKLFKREDEGSFLLWNGEDSVSGNIKHLCDSVGDRVYSDSSQYAIIDGTATDKTGIVVSIGGQFMTTASRTGNIVILTDGAMDYNQGSASDIGDLLFWEDGEISHIIGSAYNSGTSKYEFTTLESGTKAEQAISWKYSTKRVLATKTHDTTYGYYKIVTGDTVGAEDIGLPLYQLYTDGILEKRGNIVSVEGPKNFTGTDNIGTDTEGTVLIIGWNIPRMYCHRRYSFIQVSARRLNGSSDQRL